MCSCGVYILRQHFTLHCLLRCNLHSTHRLEILGDNVYISYMYIYIYLQPILKILKSSEDFPLWSKKSTSRINKDILKYTTIFSKKS